MDWTSFEHFLLTVGLPTFFVLVLLWFIYKGGRFVGERIKEFSPVIKGALEDHRVLVQTLEKEEPRKLALMERQLKLQEVSTEMLCSMNEQHEQSVSPFATVGTNNGLADMAESRIQEIEGHEDVAKERLRSAKKHFKGGN